LRRTNSDELAEDALYSRPADYALNSGSARIKCCLQQGTHHGPGFSTRLDVVGGLRDARPRRAAAPAALPPNGLDCAIARLGAPVDILETDTKVLVLVALPGVDTENVEAALDGGEYLLVAGTRTLPSELRTAIIHRLELPQGRFERRVRLPAGRYEAVRRSSCHGCLLITLQKAGTFRG
jgi:HSP20 family protein